VPLLFRRFKVSHQISKRPSPRDDQYRWGGLPQFFYQAGNAIQETSPYLYNYSPHHPVNVIRLSIKAKESHVLFMRWWPALLLLMMLLLPVDAIQIVEFCPDPYLPQDADEYLVLEAEGILDSITISDGEGGFRFPPGTRSDGRVVIAREGDAYSRVHEYPPDFEMYDTSPTIPDVIRGGNFQMSNTGDEIFLYLDSRLVQEIHWPSDMRSTQGQIHFLDQGRWDPRPLFLGQSRFTSLTVDHVSVTTFVSPDCSYPVIRDAIQRSTRSILINAYEFSHPGIARLLVEAHARGVEVTVLLEGGPVGGITAEEHCALSLLQESGIALYKMESQGDDHAKYRFNHAKYMVLDTVAVLITSENFNEHGFPSPGEQGNRGWGVYIEDPFVAAYFSNVFTWDIQGGDITPFVPTPSSDCGIEESGEPYPSRFQPLRVENVTVTTVLSPDTSDLVRDLIEGGRVQIEIEQAYINNVSTSLHPFLEAAMNASRTGAAVRVLLDSYWFNVNEEQDNDEMVELANRIGRGEGIPFTARLARLEGQGPEKIHNKGVIVDGGRVLVSSINWNEQSPFYNREAGVILDHPAVAAYYLEVFEEDWDRGSNSPTTWDGTKIGVAILVILILTGIYLLKQKSR
jgi:cardiolipin synthase